MTQKGEVQEIYEGFFENACLLYDAKPKEKENISSFNTEKDRIAQKIDFDRYQSVGKH